MEKFTRNCRIIQQTYGLKVTQMGRILGFTGGTWKRYLAGDRPIPAHANLVALLVNPFIFRQHIESLSESDDLPRKSRKLIVPLLTKATQICTDSIMKLSILGRLDEKQLRNDPAQLSSEEGVMDGLSPDYKTEDHGNFTGESVG